jgi:hypothetical protein
MGFSVRRGDAVQPLCISQLLHYIEGGNPHHRLMAFPISPGSRPIAAGTSAKVLFEFSATTFNPEANAFAYGPSPDGQRFLVSVYADENAEPTLNVLVNWQALAKKGATAP